MTRCRRFVSAVAIAILCVCGYAQNQPAGDQRSLGDIARELREKKRPNVQVTANDAKELFAAVDEIVGFASQDTGFSRRFAVKRQMLSRSDFEHHVADLYSGNDEQKRLARSEVVLKKFGLLAPEFDLKSFLPKKTVESVGAYYSPKEKTMYLMDWVPFEAQRPIMAHELTHALQDQNFDLSKFMKAGTSPASDIPRMSVAEHDVWESATARRAVVEGQAMLVYMDYMLKDSNRSLSDSPAAIDRLQARLQTYDSPIAFHNAPRIIKDVGTFPYREGFAFELELLKKRGRDTAFAGVFARPPLSTHEVLQPDSYLARSKPPVITIPDLRPILGDTYEPYDSGSMGELDIRIMVRDFGTENDLYSVAPNWDGGSYVVVKRLTAGTKDSDNEAKLRTADVALLYISRWKSFDSARRVAQLYQHALPKRLKVLQQDAAIANCQNAADCGNPVANKALWAARITTDEGLVVLEIWPENTLFISHSFAESIVPQLRQAVLPALIKQRSTGHNAGSGEPNPQRELSARLYECAAFVEWQESIQQEIVEDLAGGLEPR